MDKISIIIPVYNVEKYLDKCVQSIIDQTYKNIEIILVDDGSPDNCPKMCDDYAKKDDRIIVIHKENGGLSDARNKGIEISSGDYLMMVDSDDYVSSDICERLLLLIKSHDANLAMCASTFVYEDGQKSNERISENEKAICFDRSDAMRHLFRGDILFFMTAWAKLYDRAIFEEIRYPVGKLHEDEFVIANVLDKASKVVYTERPMYFYLKRSTSIMGQKGKKNIEHIFQAYQIRYDFLKSLEYIDQNENKKSIMQNLRTLYIESRPYGDIRAKIWDYYKSIYKELKVKDKKNFLFRHFRPIYILLYSIKNKRRS